MRLANFFLLLVLYFLFPAGVLAQEPSFAVSTESIYQIQESGTAIVTQNLTLTNLTSDFFPREYFLPTGILKIEAPHGSDRLGSLAVTTQNDGLKIKFNDSPAGLGKTLRFNLYYQAENLAQKPGRLWQIFIPPPAKTEGQIGQVVRLVVPPSFGKLVFAKPAPKSADFFWDMVDLKNDAISLGFDPDLQEIPYEAYDFVLKYHLYNSRLYPVISKIVLPADSPLQKIFINSIAPKPANVTADQDGNYVAEFPIGPAARLDISASGKAAVFAKPVSFAAKPDSLQKSPYWPVSDREIQTIAKGLASEQDIYHYILKTLRYDTAKTDRSGAKAALLSPQKANAWDFSDLFITLALAKNLPGREITGYVAGRINNWHVWPENHDPALAQTQNLDYSYIFDLDHLALAVNATSHHFALPTELYIKPVAENLLLEAQPKVTASFRVAKQITAGFSSTGKIFVENLGPASFLSQTVGLSAQKLDLPHQVFLTDTLPPFGHQEFSVPILTPGPTANFSDTISLRFGLEKQDYPIEVVPLYRNVYLSIFGGLIFLGVLSIFAQITRGLFFQKRARQDDLRR